MLGVTKLSSPTPDRRHSSAYYQNDSTEEIPPPLSPSFREKIPHYEIPTREGHDLFLLGLNDERFIIPKTGSFTTEYKENDPLGPKSSSFSGKSKKRVSFTDSTDITDLNLAREIALRNRDRQQDPHTFHEFHEEAHSSQEAEAQSPRRRRSSVAIEDWGNVLDQISSELNIRPIRRKSEESKFNTTDKFYSENDLADRSHRIPPRKLSAPITPVKAEDVNVIISEISEELNIGPRFSRSRSSSRTLQSPVVLTLSNSSGEDTSRLNSLTDSIVEPNTSSESSNLLVTPSIVSSESDGIVVKNLSVADEATTTTDGGVAGGGSSSATRMDRSVDSIGSCSLDVDLSTDFSGMSLSHHYVIKSHIFGYVTSLAWCKNVVT